MKIVEIYIYIRKNKKVIIIEKKYVKSITVINIY